MAKNRHATATDLWAALNATYDPKEWAVMPEVANGTGSAKCRSADAVAMNLWPSRGMEVHGFEFKVDRSDWVREKDNPAKAEAVARYCHRWWLVVSRPEIVGPGELPGGWGLMVLEKGTLRTATAAAKREPDELNRTFVAALLRAARTFVVPDDIVRATIERERAALYQEKQAIREVVEKQANRRASELQDRIDTFERSTGLSLSGWSAVENAKEVLRLVKMGGVEGMREKMLRIGREAEALAAFARSLREPDPATPAVVAEDDDLPACPARRSL
jgi:hypothetical protein